MNLKLTVTRRVNGAVCITSRYLKSDANILACHPAQSQEWLGWAAIRCELWCISTGTWLYWSCWWMSLKLSLPWSTVYRVFPAYHVSRDGHRGKRFTDWSIGEEREGNSHVVGDIGGCWFRYLPPKQDVKSFSPAWAGCGIRLIATFFAFLFLVFRIGKKHR